MSRMAAVEYAMEQLDFNKNDVHALLDNPSPERLNLLYLCLPLFQSQVDIIQKLPQCGVSGICPTCFIQSFIILQDIHSLAYTTRISNPAFWQSCVELITAPRSDEEKLVLQQQLVRNVESCTIMHIDPPDTADPARIYHDFFKAAIACVNLCFSIGDDDSSDSFSLMTRAKVGKGFQFRSAANMWPLLPAHLMPHGARRTVEAILDWGCELVSVSAFHGLSNYVAILRPYLFPHLLKSPLRPRLLWLLARVLLADFRTPLADWPGEEPCPLFEGESEDDDVLVHSSSLLLTVIVNGPDCRLDDVDFLVQGYEPLMFRAAQHAMHAMRNSDMPRYMLPQMLEPLRDFVIVLHRRLRLPDSVLDPRTLHYMRTTFNPSLNRQPYRDLSHTMALFFKELQRRRSCAGPGCNKVVQDNESGRAFQRCGRCRLPAYCGRACQRADWKDGLAVPLRDARIAHKEVCPILCRVITAVQMDSTSIPQFAAQFRRLGLEVEDLRILRDWALASRVLPPDIAADMAGLTNRADDMSHEEYVRLGLAVPIDRVLDPSNA